MPKVRVYELAREFDLPNKEILDELTQSGIIVRSHSSSVDEGEARAALKAAFAKKKVMKAPTSAPQEATEAPAKPGVKKMTPPARAKVSPEKSARVQPPKVATSPGTKTVPLVPQELPQGEVTRKAAVLDHPEVAVPLPSPTPAGKEPDVVLAELQRAEAPGRELPPDEALRR